jgi:hypothetical protein
MSTIKQKTVTVENIDGKTVEVRRMRWKSAREFLKKFSAIASALYKDAPAGISFGELLISRLAEIIGGSDELVLLLVTGSTEFKPDEIDALDALSVLEILAAAMKVNFDDELKKSLAGIGAEVAALMPAKATTN